LADAGMAAGENLGKRRQEKDGLARGIRGGGSVRAPSGDRAYENMNCGSCWRSFWANARAGAATVTRRAPYCATMPVSRTARGTAHTP